MKLLWILVNGNQNTLPDCFSSVTLFSRNLLQTVTRNCQCTHEPERGELQVSGQLRLSPWIPARSRKPEQRVSGNQSVEWYNSYMSRWVVLYPIQSRIFVYLNLCWMTDYKLLDSCRIYSHSPLFSIIQICHEWKTPQPMKGKGTCALPNNSRTTEPPLLNCRLL